MPTAPANPLAAPPPDHRPVEHADSAQQERTEAEEMRTHAAEIDPDHAPISMS